MDKCFLSSRPGALWKESLFFSSFFFHRFSKSGNSFFPSFLSRSPARALKLSPPFSSLQSLSLFSTPDTGAYRFSFMQNPSCLSEALLGVLFCFDSSPRQTITLFAYNPSPSLSSPRKPPSAIKVGAAVGLFGPGSTFESFSSHDLPLLILNAYGGSSFLLRVRGGSRLFLPLWSLV